MFIYINIKNICKLNKYFVAFCTIVDTLYIFKTSQDLGIKTLCQGNSLFYTQPTLSAKVYLERANACPSPNWSVLIVHSNTYFYYVRKTMNSYKDNFLNKKLSLFENVCPTLQVECHYYLLTSNNFYIFTTRVCKDL